MTELGPRLSGYRERAECALGRVFQELAAPADERLFAAMRYSLLAGGKRLRPVLLYAAADAVGTTEARANDVDRVACALECIHTYSLIHDDLPAMDDDDLRRGVPSCHRAFGEATAILAGDGLHTLAFELLADAESIPAALRVRLIEALARASGASGMVGGQAIDMAYVARSIDIATLEQMHRLKTGALIGAALRMGAILGQAGAAELSALDAYGRAIGLAFQVRDDILDQSGSADQLGKLPGADATRLKPTYMTLLGIEAARGFADSLCKDALQALQRFGASADPLRELAAYIVGRDR